MKHRTGKQHASTRRIGDPAHASQRVQQSPIIRQGQLLAIYRVAVCRQKPLEHIGIRRMASCHRDQDRGLFQLIAHRLFLFHDLRHGRQLVQLRTQPFRIQIRRGMRILFDNPLLKSAQHSVKAHVEQQPEADHDQPCDNDGRGQTIAQHIQTPFMGH